MLCAHFIDQKIVAFLGEVIDKYSETQDSYWFGVQTWTH
jgi:hypothetical protein